MKPSSNGFLSLSAAILVFHSLLLIPDSCIAKSAPGAQSLADISSNVANQYRVRKDIRSTNRAQDFVQGISKLADAKSTERLPSAAVSSPSVSSPTDSSPSDSVPGDSCRNDSAPNDSSGITSTKITSAQPGASPEPHPRAVEPASQSHQVAGGELINTVEACPGPLEPERRALLQQIRKAETQGVGISAYMNAFTDIEQEVKAGRDTDAIKTKIQSVCKSLANQFVSKEAIRNQSIQMQASPSVYLGAKSGDAKKENTSELAGLSYSGLYVNHEEPDIYNFLRFYADGTVRSITFVQRPQETSDQLIEYVKTHMNSFNKEADTAHVDVAENLMKFSCGGLNYIASVIPGGIGVLWVSTVSKKRGKCGYYFVAD